MKSGRLKPVGETESDEVIAGSERDPAQAGPLPDADPSLAA
jgi:hypothetical protein